MSAIPQYTKSIAVSWMEIHQDAKKLSEILKKHPDFTNWKQLITITRGGLIPSAIISRYLGLYYIDTLCVRSYEEPAEGIVETNPLAGELQFIKSLPTPDDQGASILIIDDLVDKGDTAKAVKAMFPKAHLAVLYAKPSGKPYADTHVRDIPQDAWIYFPWELEPHQVK